MRSVDEIWQNLSRRVCLADTADVSLQIDEFFVIGTFFLASRTSK